MRERETDSDNVITAKKTTLNSMFMDKNIKYHYVLIFFIEQNTNEQWSNFYSF